MIRFFNRSAGFVGLCMLALAIGCGGSSKTKSNCDGPCADAVKDGGDARKDGGPDVKPGDARDTGILPDTSPLPDGAMPDIATTDAYVPPTDVPPVSPDTAGDVIVVTPDTRLPDTQPDTRLPDTATVDTKTPDTATPDAPVDAPWISDVATDVGEDAPELDVAPDANDDVLGDAGDDATTDADIDTTP